MRGSILLTAAAASVLTGCHKRPEIETAPSPAASCYPTGPAVPTTATVALTGAVNPRNAPLATNNAERVVFAQLYETLISIDCVGNASRGLADAWWADPDDSSTFFVRLKPAAHYSDGEAVTARTVVGDWQRRGLAGGGTELFDLAAEDSVTLRVHFYAHPYNLEQLLSAPERSVMGTRNRARWSIGTTGYLVATSSDRRIVLNTDRVGLPATIRYDVFPGDLRDALDRGVGFTLTAGASAVDYAAELPDYTATPAPFATSYFLVAMTGQPNAVDDLAGDRTRFARAILGGNTANIRAYQWPLQWNPSICGAPPTLLTQRRPIETIEFDPADATSRFLAERLAFLGGNNRLPSRLRQISETANAVPQTTGSPPGHGAARVVAVNRFAQKPCGILGLDAGIPGLSAIALVDSRNHNIIRNTIGGLLISADGTPKFAPQR